MVVSVSVYSVSAKWFDEHLNDNITGEVSPL